MIHVKYYATRGAALLVSLLSIHSLTHSLTGRACVPRTPSRLGINTRCSASWCGGRTRAAARWPRRPPCLGARSRAPVVPADASSPKVRQTHSDSRSLFSHWSTRCIARRSASDTYHITTTELIERATFETEPLSRPREIDLAGLPVVDAARGGGGGCRGGARERDRLLGH